MILTSKSVFSQGIGRLRRLKLNPTLSVFSMRTLSSELHGGLKCFPVVGLSKYGQAVKTASSRLLEFSVLNAPASRSVHTSMLTIWKAVPRQSILQTPVEIRGFHTTPQRHVPPVLWLLFKPVAKLGAILTGRSARKWWQSLSKKKRQHFWEHVQERWYLVALVAAVLSGAGVVYYNSHIEETPITGRGRYIAVTHEQFMKIASVEAETHLANYKDKMLPANHPIYQRVLRVGNRLVDSNQEIMQLMGTTSWKCYVIDDPTTINAFVLPTGHVFVFKGILDFAKNDDQLAVIIAHEMAHALLNHGIEQVSYVQLVDFLIIATMAALWCVMPTDGISIITQWFYNKFINIMLHMPYSRMLEKEADKVGLEMAARACYDVREGSVFWARMSLNEEITAQDDSLPEWLSTHPSHGKRVELFDFLIPKAMQIREGAKCPALPTTDPRETIKVMSALVDDHLTAKKTGQNLSRVKFMIPPAAVTKS